MAGNGPPPKPIGRRQRRNPRTSTERAGVGLVVVAGGRQAAPAPPAGLLKATREAWSAFWSSPLAPMVVPATDLPALERLFTLRDERARALRGYRARRLVVTDSGVALNPLLRVLKQLDAEIRQLEDRFGLSPIARLRLGVALGEAARSLEELLDDDDDDDPDQRRGAVDAGA
jgi:P27 family predicted phage terminase small subunit